MPLNRSRAGAELRDERLFGAAKSQIGHAIFFQIQPITNRGLDPAFVFSVSKNVGFSLSCNRPLCRSRRAIAMLRTYHVNRGWHAKLKCARRLLVSRTRIPAASQCPSASANWRHLRLGILHQHKRRLRAREKSPESVPGAGKTVARLLIEPNCVS